MPTLKGNEPNFGEYVPLVSAIPRMKLGKRFFGAPTKFHNDKAIELNRALKKSLSFRVFATIGTFAVTYVFTGNIITGVGVSTAQALTNTTIYYFHEKYWDKNERGHAK